MDNRSVTNNGSQALTLAGIRIAPGTTATVDFDALSRGEKHVVNSWGASLTVAPPFTLAPDPLTGEPGQDAAIAANTTAVTGEASTRGTADTAFSAALATETAARIAADTGEATARGTADTTINTALTAETAARIAADTTINTALTAETAARIAGDSGGGGITSPLGANLDVNSKQLQHVDVLTTGSADRMILAAPGGSFRFQNDGTLSPSSYANPILGNAADGGGDHGWGLILRACTVAALPANPSAPMILFATNGRKVGELLGAGTGVPVYFSGGAWRVFGTDAAVQA